MREAIAETAEHSAVQCEGSVCGHASKSEAEKFGEVSHIVITFFEVGIYFIVVVCLVLPKIRMGYC